MGVSMMIGSNPVLKAHAANFAEFMRSNPLLGAALHAVLSTAITVSGVPFSLVDLAAAWVYPMPVAMCMLLFAKTLGSALCFVVARCVLSDARKANIKAHATVRRVDRLLVSSPIYYGTLFRVSLMPAVVKNYGLALLDVNFRQYIVCCLLGSCIGVPAQAHLGSTLGGVYLGVKDMEDMLNTMDPTVLLGSMAPALSMLILMPTIAKVLLGKDEDDKQNEDDKETTATPKDSSDRLASEGKSEDKENRTDSHATNANSAEAHEKQKDPLKEGPVPKAKGGPTTTPVKADPVAAVKKHSGCGEEADLEVKKQI